MQGVGGQLGGMTLAGHEPAERGGDGVCVYASGVQERNALHQLDQRAAGSGDSAAAIRVEAGGRDPRALDPHRYAHHVTAGGPAGGPRVRLSRKGAVAGGQAQVIGE